LLHLTFYILARSEIASCGTGQKIYTAIHRSIFITEPKSNRLPLLWVIVAPTSPLLPLRIKCPQSSRQQQLLVATLTTTKGVERLALLVPFIHTYIFWSGSQTGVPLSCDFYEACINNCAQRPPT